MDMKDIKGMRRGTVLMVALLASGAPLAAQGAGAASRVMVTARQDSAGREVVLLRQLPPRIDSLIKRLNTLPIGSAEFRAVDDSIWTAIRAMPQPSSFATGGGEFRIVTAPTARQVLPFSPMDLVPHGWFGFVADGVTREWDRPNGHIVHHLVYPTVVAIEPNSPASRAGVRSGDSLMAYDGLDLRENVVNMTQLLTPGREVTVRLRREGEAKELVLTVEKAPASLMAERRAAAARALVQTRQEERRITELRAATEASRVPLTGPRPPLAGGAVTAVGRSVYMPTLAPAVSGIYGAAMTSVDESLASSLIGMDGKHGVLVTAVPPSSPAFARGLRNGDVILRVRGVEVPTVSQLRVRLAAAEQNGIEKVVLTILRGGKTQDLPFELK